MLDRMADHSKRLDHMAGDVYAVDLKTLRQSSNLTLEAFAIRMLNLERLGLIELIATSGFSIGQRYSRDFELDLVGLTRLGSSLLQACRGPGRLVSGDTEV